MSTPEVRKGIPGVVKGVVAAGVLATAGLGAAVGLGAFNRGEQRPDVTPTPSAAAASPTPKETATPIVTKSPEPSPSKTPEAPPTPCIIVEQKYCDQARRIMLDVNGPKVLYIAVNLPAGTPLYAPADGLSVKAQESGNLKGFVAQIRGTSSGSVFRGDIKLDDMTQKAVKAGDIMGYVGNTGVKVGDSVFNIAFTISKATDQGPTVDEEKLKQLFPKAFEKPLASITQDPPGQPTVVKLFDSNPPINKP